MPGPPRSISATSPRRGDVAEIERGGPGIHLETDLRPPGTGEIDAPATGVEWEVEAEGRCGRHGQSPGVPIAEPEPRRATLVARPDVERRPSRVDLRAGTVSVRALEVPVGSLRDPDRHLATIETDRDVGRRGECPVAWSERGRP